MRPSRTGKQKVKPTAYFYKYRRKAAFRRAGYDRGDNIFTFKIKMQKTAEKISAVLLLLLISQALPD